MKRKYERLQIEPFGIHLIESGDLDPIYIALVKSDFSLRKKKQWLLAYWCFYHAGVACWMSELPSKKFFEEMMVAAKNEEASPSPVGGRWPRAKERRHARGKQAVRMVEFLRNAYQDQPSKMADYCSGQKGSRTCHEVMERAKEHHLFGNWIAFKVADMIDRCLGTKIDFDQGAAFMFKDPVDSALMLWKERAGLPENAKPRDTQKAIADVVEYLTGYFSHYSAPPLHDRPIDLQEVETILCKWKSHRGGFYPLFNDQDEINESLEPWKKYSKNARIFAEAMPSNEAKRLSSEAASEG